MGSKPNTAAALLISRRRFLKLGLGAAGTAGLMSSGLAGTVLAASPASAAGTRDSIDRAYSFLNTMMDAYEQGTTLRLIQSYSDQLGLFSTAFTYDNALAIIAYLARRKRDDLERAMLLGDSLLYAQAHDPNYSDGRLRQAYNVGPYTFYDGSPQPDTFIHPDGTVNIGWQFGFVGSAVGDMAWAAIALSQLAFYTRESRYLDGALRLGQWIYDTTYATNGPGGYNFGVDGGNNLLTFKSSEHNIDVYALFNMLAQLTGDATWTERADHARDFLAAMWNAEGGFFWTGTNPDGVTINYYPIPEDVQTWSYLALRDATYAVALDWTAENLATTDQQISGVTFSTASLVATAPNNPNAVWLEGTAQLAAALLERGGSDRAAAVNYLDNIRLAQAQLGQGETVGGQPIPTGLGVVAA
ncbi:MAG TPA: hypothetical protein VFX76_22140, partial [Roseiflexaceae bacterium]|nr:hypothetical protein [Roseiflexaceae bacterium]